jgi:hypothetical protein
MADGKVRWTARRSPYLFFVSVRGMKAVYLYSCLVGIVILVGYYKSKGVFLKKLLDILILLLISRIVFADEYVGLSLGFAL